MKSNVLSLSVVMLLSVGIWLTVVKHNANAQAQHVRWDILTTATDVTPGGVRIRYILKWRRIPSSRR